MSKVHKQHVSLSALEVSLLAVAALLIGLVLWFVHTARTDSDNSLQTSSSTSNQASSNQDDRSLQADVNSVSNDTSQANQDLDNASSSLNDQSSFTAVP